VLCCAALTDECGVAARIGSIKYRRKKRKRRTDTRLLPIALLLTFGTTAWSCCLRPRLRLLPAILVEAGEIVERTGAVSTHK
jgi:hypothetical protein